MTLVETVLTLVLLLALAGVAVVSVAGWRGSAAFVEAVTRLETSLRMARADAANQGRAIRLVLAEDGDGFSLTWEPEPLARPGQFEPYTLASWADMLPEQQMRVVRCELQGASLDARRARAAFSEADPDDEATDTIEFRPDGGCDSAVFELAPPADEDDRRAVIHLDGVNGTVETVLLTVDQLEDHYAQRADPAAGDL